MVGTMIVYGVLGQGAEFFPEMAPREIWNRYVRYIGAGAVATGGIITLVKSIPTMIESFKLGLAQIGKGEEAASIDPTDRDLSFRTVLLIIGAVLLVLTTAGSEEQAVQIARGLVELLLVDRRPAHVDGIERREQRRGVHTVEGFDLPGLLHHRGLVHLVSPLRQSSR